MADVQYHVRHEAYDWPIVVELGDHSPTVLVVAGYDEDDGSFDWTFDIAEHRVAGQAMLRLDMLSDSWRALTEFRPFFDALDLGEASSLDDVRTILDSLDATDATARVAPVA